MNYFPIVPVKYLSDLAILSNHHMVLAQWLDNKRYLTFYQKMRERGDYIILDNGCAELGHSLPVEELVDKYIMLGGANILIIPDSDGKDNLEVIEKAERYLYKSSISTNFMVVPHTPDELKILAKNHAFIGINRIMDDIYGRIKILKENKSNSIRFHILGMKKDPMAEVQSLKPYASQIIGIDSLLPYRLVRLGRKIEEAHPYPMNCELDDQSLEGPMLKMAKEEYKKFIEWVKA